MIISDFRRCKYTKRWGARPNNYSPITFNFFQKSMQICNMEQNINNCSKNYITYYFVNNLFFRENRYVPTYFSHLKKFIQGRTCHFHETYTTNTSPKQVLVKQCLTQKCVINLNFWHVETECHTLFCTTCRVGSESPFAILPRSG